MSNASDQVDVLETKGKLGTAVANSQAKGFSKQAGVRYFHQIFIFDTMYLRVSPLAPLGTHRRAGITVGGLGQIEY